MLDISISKIMMRITPFEMAIMPIAIVHFVWAAAILMNDSAGNVTSISTLNKGIGNWDAWAYLLASITAFSAITIVSPKWKLVLAIPQQIITIVSAWGALNAIILSQFADGVVRPREFILADQHIWVVLAFTHLLGIIWLRYVRH